MWNKAHSSLEELKANENYMRSQSIDQLISFRDDMLNKAKVIEENPRFNEWNPMEDALLSFNMFDYEDYIYKVGFACEIINRKRKSLYSYCTYSPMRMLYHELSDSIIKCIRKTPSLSYEEIINTLGNDSEYALTYLIESHKIERIGDLGKDYWKIW